MIGSLGEFIPLDPQHLFEDLSGTEKDEGEAAPTGRKKRGQSAFETYQP